MTQTHDVRRHRDCSIDFDFYRTRAVALRSQAMRDASKRKVFVRFTLITTAVLAVTVITASAPVHRVYCRYCTPNSATYVPGGSSNGSAMNGTLDPIAAAQLASTGSQAD
jgi:Asp-tRNA(Asn)/Glu-tRNA(Gln) amidotransferase A subunit family amidase